MFHRHILLLQIFMESLDYTDSPVGDNFWFSFYSPHKCHLFMTSQPAVAV